MHKPTCIHSWLVHLTAGCLCTTHKPLGVSASTWAALEAKLREERVSPADAASGDRLQTSITLEDPQRESCSTCMADRAACQAHYGAITASSALLYHFALPLAVPPILSSFYEDIAHMNVMMPAIAFP